MARSHMGGLVRLREDLHEIGLDTKPIFAISYAAVFVCPDLQYEELLAAYAEHAMDEPGRIHSDFCIRLMRAGFQGTPEAFIQLIRTEYGVK